MPSQGCSRAHLWASLASQVLSFRVLPGTSRARPSRPSPAPDLVPLAQPREAAFRPFELCSLDWTVATSHGVHTPATARLAGSSTLCASRAPLPTPAWHVRSSCWAVDVAASPPPAVTATGTLHAIESNRCWITLHFRTAAKTRRESGPGIGVRRDRHLATSRARLPLTAPSLAAASPAERRPPRPRLRSRRAPQNSWSWYSPPSRSP